MDRESRAEPGGADCVVREPPGAGLGRQSRAPSVGGHCTDLSQLLVDYLEAVSSIYGFPLLEDIVVGLFIDIFICFHEILVIS